MNDECMIYSLPRISHGATARPVVHFQGAGWYQSCNRQGSTHDFGCVPKFEAKLMTRDRFSCPMSGRPVCRNGFITTNASLAWFLGRPCAHLTSNYSRSQNKYRAGWLASFEDCASYFRVFHNLHESSHTISCMLKSFITVIYIPSSP